MYHQVLIVGKVGREPEMKYLDTGTAVCRFSVCTTEKIKSGERKVWAQVTVFGKTAENCNQYLHTGSNVLVSAKLNPDENGNPKIWKDKNGNARSSYEITADTVKFLPGKTDGAPAATAMSDFDDGIDL